MPKQPTPAQIAANRRNAQKSTGPRTPEGKARAARNAVKRALLADQSVVTEADAPQDPDQFDELLADLNDQFEPQTRLETVLVERVALCFWRLRRAQHYETAAIHRAIQSPPDEPDPADDELAEIEQELEKAQTFRKQHAQNLRFLENLDLDDPDAAERAAPMLARLRRRYARDVDMLTDHHLREVLLQKLPEYIHDEKDRIPDLKRQLAQAREAADQARHRRTLTAALPSTEEVLKLVRYENMLDRQLHRALNELRRLQQFRQQPDPDVALPLVGGAPADSRPLGSGPEFDARPAHVAPSFMGGAPTTPQQKAEQNEPEHLPNDPKNPGCVKKTNPNEPNTIARGTSGAADRPSACAAPKSPTTPHPHSPLRHPPPRLSGTPASSQTTTQGPHPAAGQALPPTCLRRPGPNERSQPPRATSHPPFPSLPKRDPESRKAGPQTATAPLVLAIGARLRPCKPGRPAHPTLRDTAARVD